MEPRAPDGGVTDQKAARRIICLVLFLDLLGFGLVIPQMPFYAIRCGVGGMVVGLITGTYSLLQFLMSPVWGRVSDRIGRRPVILIGLCGAGVSYVVFGAAFRIAAITGLSPVLILTLSRITAGFFNANIAVAQACMADVTAPEERTAAMGLVGAAIAMGFVLGPGITIAVEHFTGSMELPFYLAAASELFCLQWAWRALPETRAKDAPPVTRRGWSTWSLVPAGPLRQVLLTAVLATAAFSGMENTLGLYVVDEPTLHYDVKGFAQVLLFLSAVIVITQGFLVKPLARRLRECRMLGAGALSMTVGLLALSVARTSPVLYAAVAALCFGYGLASPSLSGLNARLAPEAVRGELLGLGQSMTSLGRVIGPIAGGWFYQSVSRGSTYVFGAILAVLCVAVAAVLDRQVPAEA